MNLRKTAAALALVVGAAGAQFSASPAFATEPDERGLWETLKKSAEGAVTQSDRITFTPQQINQLLDPNLANP